MCFNNFNNIRFEKILIAIKNIDVIIKLKAQHAKSLISFSQILMSINREFVIFRNKVI